MEIKVSLKDLIELVSGKSEFKKTTGEGKNYLIRTVTMIYSGEVVAEYQDHFILKKAAWIADAGRWADNLVSCEFSEVEPYPAEKEVVVMKGGVLDIVEIEKLPLLQK